MKICDQWHFLPNKNPSTALIQGCKVLHNESQNYVLPKCSEKYTWFLLVQLAEFLNISKNDANTIRYVWIGMC